MNKFDKPNFIEFFYNQKIKDDPSEKSLDLLGFSEFEDELAEELLPKLNKRIWKAKYFFLSAMILFSKEDEYFRDLNMDEWVMFCENWFTLGVFKKNKKEFNMPHTIGKNSKKLKQNKDLFLNNLLIQNQKSQGPYAVCKSVLQRFKDENVRDIIKEFKGSFITQNQYEHLKKAFKKRSSRSAKELFEKSRIFTFKLSSKEKKMLRYAFCKNENRKLIYSMFRKDRHLEDKNVLELLNMVKTLPRLRHTAKIAIKYYRLVEIITDVFELICYGEKEKGLKIKLKELKDELKNAWKGDIKEKLKGDLFNFFNNLSKSEPDKIKNLIIRRHQNEKPGGELIKILKNKPKLTRLGEVKIDSGKRFGKPHSFRLNNLREILRDIER